VNRIWGEPVIIFIELKFAEAIVKIGTALTCLQRFLEPFYFLSSFIVSSFRLFVFFFPSFFPWVLLIVLMKKRGSAKYCGFSWASFKIN
jgi:hypothetical protein